MSNLQPNQFYKIDFQKMDQHAGGKWLIHDTKRRKDNQLQSLKLPLVFISLQWRIPCFQNEYQRPQIRNIILHLQTYLETIFGE